MDSQLKDLGDSLKQKSKDKSATVVDAAKASFTRVQAALEALKESGRAYDQKFKVRHLTKAIYRSTASCRCGSRAYCSVTVVV